MRRSRAAGVALATLALAAGCARKLPPPGGRADVEPPRIVSTVPESGAVAVPRTRALEIVFNEPMRHDAPSWLAIGPYVQPRKLEWQGRALRFVLGDTLRAGQTYTMIVGSGAVDERGNPVTGVRFVPFTTDTAFAPGEVAGRVVGRGHASEGVYVWGYRADLGHAADSTARDFDALGVAGPGGRFRLVGLPVPSRWRLYAFHDANRTLSFEPDVDQLTPDDTTVALTAAAPRADSLLLVSLDPRAPGVVAGTVGPLVVPEGGQLRVLAEPAPARAGETAQGELRAGSAAADAQLAFRISLEPGRYLLRAYVDRNHNGQLDAGSEPASAPLEITVPPGGEVTGVRLPAPPGP